jgi:hypothetical protein
MCTFVLIFCEHNVRAILIVTPFSQGHLAVVKYLVEVAKVPVNPLDHEHKTPLELLPALCSELRQYLLDAGAVTGEDARAELESK